MKVKYLGTLLLSAVLTFFGCDDNTGTLGTGMLPGSDSVSVHTTLFDVTTRSIVADAVYAKTSTGYIGRFTDPDFGYYESSFLTELNCIDDFKFPEKYDFDSKTGVLTDDTVAGVRLIIYYSTWFGDSLNACRMSAYQLDKKLERNRYTNIDPTEFYNKYDPNALLGRKAYSAYDTSIPDSVRFGVDSYGNKIYSPHVAITLDKEKFGNRLLKLSKEHPEYFKNSDAFIEHVLKGVYIKSDYGDGTILYADQVDLQMQYEFYVLNDTTGLPNMVADENDITKTVYQTGFLWRTEFSSTKEVIQANQFLNSEKIKELAQEEGHTYIKSPAGIFTEATLPYDAIYKELPRDTLNAVKLTFTNYNQESKFKFSMSAPSYVLLLRKQDFKSFFEGNKLPDNVTSYAVSHNNVATNQYTFNNIARLVDACLNEKQAARMKAKEAAGSSWNEAEWENKWNTDEETKDWDKVLLVPVAITYDSNTQQPTMTGVLNDLKPGYAKLKGGPQGDALKLEVTYTSFNSSR
ncbi:DUF4270 domain-containing protein [Bacteroides sp. UBA939]|uniref:DUF4270 domain-containing protein n=1 Tax=Bacteroides sp. UBA939 TaxID=1946092 RepID=UPI0025C003B3|nr:DUF4270 domain-containing protein [Bacteroides sp. UBA939]